MREIDYANLDPAGYADCVLDSGDDYEPYGFAPTALQLAQMTGAHRNPAFDRVIEAQLLAQSCMVGC
jgi:hypothetical protein